MVRIKNNLIFDLSNQPTMTQKEYRKSISSRVRDIIKNLGLRYIDIIIDTKYSILSVEFQFFAQGESADEIIQEINLMAQVTQLSPKTCALAYLDSAGVLKRIW